MTRSLLRMGAGFIASMLNMELIERIMAAKDAMVLAPELIDPSEALPEVYTAGMQFICS